MQQGHRRAQLHRVDPADDAQVISQFARVLKPGGTASVSVYYLNGVLRAWPQARRRYAEGSKKRIKSEKRYARHTRRYQRFQDRVAGAPTR